jgi:hypothetical protein
VNALANAAVGDYLNQHCVSSFQKVGTFRVTADGQKQGGNVATYFCLPDGSVLHILAGPVDADTFLTEAKWVVEVRKNALFEARTNLTRYRAFLRAAHQERLAHDGGASDDNRQQVHALLAKSPLIKIENVYKYVFEKILGEKISLLPVARGG